MTLHSRFIKTLIATAFVPILAGCATSQSQPGTYLIEFINDSKELILSMKVPVDNLDEQHSGQQGSSTINKLDPEEEVMNVRKDLCKTMPAVRSVVTSPTGKVLLDEKCPQSN